MPVDATSMPDAGAPWLATMRELAGVKEYAGGADNPTILGWARFIGNRYPEMADYCAAYKHDAIPWCGLTVAYCMAKNGIRPVFGAIDVERFLWAAAWATFGTPLAAPRPGCLMVFTRNGGGHVAILVRVEGDTFVVIGGNQANAVNEMRIAQSQFTAAVWPDSVAAWQGVRTPPDVRVRMGKAIVKWEARRDAQGRLMVHHLAADDGGGTYEVAGINDRYHPVEAARLKAMIAAGRQAEAEAFVAAFVASYTDVAEVWSARWGIAFYLRDCVFNRGPTGAARILQRALGDVAEDGEVGPLTRASLERAERDTAGFVRRLRAARESYERDPVGRSEASRYWAGLVNRWNDQATIAMRFDAEQPTSQEAAAMPDPSTSPAPNPSQLPGTSVTIDVDRVADAFKSIAPLLPFLMAMLRGVPPPSAPSPTIDQPPPAPPPAVAAPPASTAGFGTGILGLVGYVIANAFGVVGSPAGPEATAAGQIIPAVLGGVTALGATGKIGAVVRVIGTVFGVLSRARAAAQPRPGG